MHQSFPYAIIVFLGGSCGDFITSMVNSGNISYDKHQRKVRDVMNEKFKQMMAKIYLGDEFDASKYKHHDPSVNLSNYPFRYVECTHYFNQDIEDTFPNSKFFYIDIEDYEAIALDRFNAVANTADPSEIQQTQKRDLMNYVITNKKLKAHPSMNIIPFRSLLDYDSCNSMIQSNFNVPVDREQYDSWRERNSFFFGKV